MKLIVALTAALFLLSLVPVYADDGPPTTVSVYDDGGSYSRPLTDTSVYDDGGSYSVPRGCESLVWPADNASSSYGEATDSNGQK